MTPLTSVPQLPPRLSPRLSEDAPIDEIVDLTCSLMSFRTTPNAPHEERSACLRFLADWCAREALNPLVMDNQRECYLYLGPASCEAPLLVLSHFDVADAPQHMFAPFCCGDQLYGRGAVDDKYAVAMSLILYRDFCRLLRRHGGSAEDVPLMLVLSGVEESEGKSSTFPLLQSLRPEFCVVLDGGASNRIVTTAKGILQLELQSAGIAADSAKPWMGKSAVDSLIGDYLALSSYFQLQQADETGEHWYPTMNLGMIYAGTMLSQVPDSANALLDVRFTDQKTPEELYQELCGLVGGALVLRHKEPLFQSLPSRWKDALFQLTGATDKRGQGGDTGHFLSRMEVSGVIWGADGDDSAHSTSEHLCISSLTPVWEGLVKLVNLALAERGVA